MTERGPGSDEPGPRSPAAEAARRRLYMPGGSSADAVDAFLRLDEPDPAPVDPPTPSAPSGLAETAGATSEPTTAAGRRRRAVVIALTAGGAAVAIVVAVLLQAIGPRPLPTTVPVPGAHGSTVMVYMRMSNPESAPRATTFEPADYTVYRPGGRRLGIALRCIGDGSVRISVTQRFTFHCTGRESVQVQTAARGSTQPFLVRGRTIGNVVWSMRVVLLPAG